MSTSSTSASKAAPKTEPTTAAALFTVASVVDGDTIKVWVGGRRIAVRVIGIDTPETKKPGYAVACYGKQASSHMQSLVQSRQVNLAADPSQSNVDKYGRWLRYVIRTDGVDVGRAQITGGFAREYTYDIPYARRADYLAAQAKAQSTKTGLWGGCTYAAAFAPPPLGAPTATPPTTSHPVPVPGSSGACTIKGNINSHGEKIYHLSGTASYDKTKINKPGERMFCTVAQAEAAGFRPAHD